MRERFGPMLARGATTLWESFEPTASLCHGFSASPTYQLSRRVLGVAPAAPGFAEIALRPGPRRTSTTPRASFRRRGGDVEVQPGARRDGFVARYRTPTGVGARAVPPPGFAIAAGRALTGTQIEIRFERTSRPEAAASLGSPRPSPGDDGRGSSSPAGMFALSHPGYNAPLIDQNRSCEPQARVDPR